jgi:hypothetical protein
MQKKPNIYQKSRSIDPVWHFLAEYSLNELLVNEKRGDELAVSLSFQTIQELGIPLECLKNIEYALTGFVKESLAHFDQGRSNFTIYIRIYCIKKTIEAVNSPKISRSSHTEQTMEVTQIVRYSDAKINEGWGFFLIERGAGFLASPSGSSCHFIDLYLYKEGD